MDITNEFLRRSIVRRGSDGLGVWRSRLECRDGFSMSVQASVYHYCYPRVDESPFYIQAEVGYPSEWEELLREWHEGGVNGVYGYVPIDVINEVILKHGGLAEELGETSFDSTLDKME